MCWIFEGAVECWGCLEVWGIICISRDTPQTTKCPNYPEIIPNLLTQPQSTAHPGSYNTKVGCWGGGMKIRGVYLR